MGFFGNKRGLCYNTHQLTLLLGLISISPMAGWRKEETPFLGRIRTLIMYSYSIDTFYLNELGLPLWPSLRNLCSDDLWSETRQDARLSPNHITHDGPTTVASVVPIVQQQCCKDPTS